MSDRRQDGTDADRAPGQGPDHDLSEDALFLGDMGVPPEVERAYARSLQDGSLEGVDPALVRALLDAGLAMTRSGRAVPRSPRLAIDGWELEQRAALLRAQEGARIYHQLAREEDASTFEVVRGVEQAGQALHQVQLRAGTEVLAFDRDPYFRGGLSPVQPEVMARGVAYRVIYRQAVLHEGAVLPLLRAAMDMGEESRTYPDLPMRMLIGDHEMAVLVLPVQTGESPASDAVGIVVYPSPLLEALRALFFSFWRLAIPVEEVGTSGEDEDALQREVLQLLAMGYTDEAIGREVGVSSRTVQRRISRLQQRLGASSRFMLGAQAVRQGLLPD